MTTPPPSQPIRGILFDLGDTLLDFGPVPANRLFVAGAREAHDYLEALGKAPPPRWWYILRQLWSIRWAYLKSRLTRREFDSLELLKAGAARMGHPLTDEQAEELAWRFYLPLRRRATTEEGLVELLSRLRDRGLTLGIVSNTFLPSAVLDRHVAEEGMLDLLPVRVYSCDVGVRKPHRRIFDVALERTGLEPARTLFVGDTPGEDVRGARAVGMVTVLKDAAEVSAAGRHRPDYVIGRLAELEAILDARGVSGEAGA